MVDIKISGRKVSVSDALRDHVEVKVGGAFCTRFSTCRAAQKVLL